MLQSLCKEGVCDSKDDVGRLLCLGRVLLELTVMDSEVRPIITAVLERTDHTVNKTEEHIVTQGNILQQNIPKYTGMY